MPSLQHGLRKWFAVSVPVCALLTLSVQSATASGRSHVDWALDVAVNVDDDRNSYASRSTYLHWEGIDGAPAYANRSDCSSFLRRVLVQAYGYSRADLEGWFDDPTPDAARFHETIVAERGFDLVERIGDIGVGDVIAAKYLAPTASASGHVMIAAGPARERTATAPHVPGTTQYQISVIDSARSGHGPSDTRRRIWGGYDDGAGVGTLRLYADADGSIVGYSWSTSSRSAFHGAEARPIAVGRLS